MAALLVLVFSVSWSGSTPRPKLGSIPALSAQAQAVCAPPPRRSCPGRPIARSADAVYSTRMAETPSRSHGRRAARPSALPTELITDRPDLAGAWEARVVTLFPEVFPGVLGASLTGKALSEGLWRLAPVDLRSFGEGRHRNVDDTPSGGGAGMVLRPDVMGRAIRFAMRGVPEDRERWPLVYLSPRGRPFHQAMAARFASTEGMTLIAGRFEGLDERVIERFGVEEISLGDFVMTGGEIAAMAILDATVRLLPSARQRCLDRGREFLGGPSRTPAIHPTRRMGRAHDSGSADLGRPREGRRMAAGGSPADHPRTTARPRAGKEARHLSADVRQALGRSSRSSASSVPATGRKPRRSTGSGIIIGRRVSSRGRDARAGAESLFIASRIGDSP